jgi:hypothetical protein
VYHPPPPGKGKNAKRAQVDGDVPAEQGTATSVVVDGQGPTAVVDASLDDRRA